MNKILLVLAMVSILALPAVPVFAQGGINVGSKVPAGVFTDVNGTKHNLGDYTGKKPVIIWITDLGPVSVEGVDNFGDLYRKYSARGAEFFIISTVNRRLTLDFISSSKIEVPVLMDENNPFTESLSGESGYGISPIHNFFVVDKNGTLIYRTHLPGTPTKDLDQAVSKSL